MSRRLAHGILLAALTLHGFFTLVALGAAYAQRILPLWLSGPAFAALCLAMPLYAVAASGLYRLPYRVERR